MRPYFTANMDCSVQKNLTRPNHIWFTGEDNGGSIILKFFFLSEAMTIILAKVQKDGDSLNL
jgi:hypothetical protein